MAGLPRAARDGFIRACERYYLPIRDRGELEKAGKVRETLDFRSHDGGLGPDLLTGGD